MALENTASLMHRLCVASSTWDPAAPLFLAMKPTPEKVEEKCPSNHFPLPV